MNQKMKLVAAIVAGIGAVSAQAGQMAGNPTTIYAAETVTNVANVPVPTFTYQTSEPINGPVSGTNTIYAVFKASAGTWKAATATAGGAPAAISVGGGVAPTVKLLAATSGSNAQAVNLDGALIAGPVVIGGVTYTTAADTLVYSFTIPTNAIYGLGSNIYVGSLNGAGVAASDRIGFLTGLSASLGLGTFNDCVAFAGGSVSVTTTIGNATGGAIDTIAPYAPTKTLLSSALGIAVDVTASADTAKIDAIGNASKTFTRTVGGGVAIPVNLATVKMTTSVPGTTDLSLAAYTVASMEAAANTAQFTVTGDFAAQTAVAGRFFMSASADCSTTMGALTPTFNATFTSASFSQPTTGFAPASAASSYVCYAPLGTVIVNPAAYTVTAQLADTATLTAFNFGKLSAGGTCPAVTFTSSLNASRVVVRNYSPAAANAFGWNQYTRIINSGTVDAAVTGYYQYGDGSMGTEKTIVTSVKKGGNVTVQNAAIEALLGAPVQPAGVTTNPRLVIQSPTSSLRVQNYIVMPNGAWFETSGAQNEGGTLGVTSLQE